MELAQPGDQLSRDDLQALRDWLIDEAGKLNAPLAAARDVKTMGKISDRQTALTNMAGQLNIASIALATAEAKVTAEHLTAAVKEAQQVIDRVADIKTKLKLIGSVLDFFATVLTGSGTAILSGAVNLASELKAKDKP